MGKAISKDGTVIGYDRTGHGDPVVLVGGALCDRQVHSGLAEFLAPHFTVFNYDRRGRGESGDTAPYAVAREIEDIAALIAEAGGSAALYGISSGGALALEATAAGLPVTRVAAYEPPYLTSEADAAATARQTDPVPGLIRDGRADEALEHFLGATGMPAAAVAEMRTTPAWSSLVAVAPTLVQDFAVMGDSTVPVERFAGIRVPALLLDGSAGMAFMHDAVLAVASAIGGARTITLPDQTHEVSVDALGPVLIEFFAEP
ncbi:alpha/beta fold hydrolase [Yinghuangia sp. YIM S09857]|uniref:alpha/beta fold hydrolase n=1 Tax=Yinghuangia sp. YIM S09857 TaxID=3436929 RepID=UPI003F537E71